MQEFMVVLRFMLQVLKMLDSKKSAYLKIRFWDKSSLAVLIFCFPPSFANILTMTKFTYHNTLGNTIFYRYTACRN